MTTMIQHTAYKKGARGTARDHADYIAGKGKNAGKEDVIFVYDGNLPAWARDASDFFSAADEFERGDHTVKRKSRDGQAYEKEIKGRAYTEFEWSVPRGIGDPVVWAKRVADETLGKDFVFRLAVHDAPASDGGRNINMHLMFSDRRLDGFERNRELFFKRAKSGSYRHRKTGQLVLHDPATGGTQKDRFWNHKGRPKWARGLFESHVQRELPEFTLSKSKNPEPKIGPKVKKAGEEREEQRRTVEATVIKMRALRRELEAVNLELTEFQNAPLVALLMDPRDVPHLDTQSFPTWTDFKCAFLSIAQRDSQLNETSLVAALEVCERRFAELTTLLVEHGKTVEELAALLIEQMTKDGIEVAPEGLLTNAQEDPRPKAMPDSLEDRDSSQNAHADPRWSEFEIALMNIGATEFNVSWLLLDNARSSIKSIFTDLADEIAQKGLGIVDLARLVADRLNREELGFEADFKRPEPTAAASLPQQPWYDSNGPAG